MIYQSRESVDNSLTIKNKLRVSVNIGDYRGEGKRTKSTEKRASVAIEVVDRPRGNSITYEVDYLVEDHHNVEAIEADGFDANENELLYRDQLAKENH